MNGIEMSVTAAGISPAELPAGPASQTKVARAATQFEALLITQLLRASHSEDSGWMGAGEEDAGGGQAMAMAEEFLAQSMASSGGLGIARMVTRELDRK